MNDQTSLTLHGVYMEVLGFGVLICGRSGIGKSELALSLIHHGHKLIADDSVTFTLENQQLSGRCPEILQDFLEVRGLGILNIKAMFGDSAISQSKHLQLIVKLINMSHQDLYQIDRLHGMHTERDILGIKVPEVSIPVAPGRNLAILIEAAVRNHRLKCNGYDASLEFTSQHRQQMRDEQTGTD